ncbi:hypothetical protein B566_EDAN001629 [Ephemera danica]|nr:hypothetical protein B566_EDAN001629 [Ephemera danica]
MNLLPKARGEFSEKTYWENFFKKRGSKSFDWYGEYPELCGLLHKYIKPKDNVLVIGCGNSTLSATLFDVGYRNITSIDTSSVVIKQMQDLHRDARPELIFEKRDAMDTGYLDGQFSCIIDKGTLDALMPDDNEATIQNIDRLFKEIDRILRVGGRYICISLLQPHILQHLLQRFPVAPPEGFGWPLRVCRCPDTGTDSSSASAGPSMPVFFVVCTKFKAMVNLPSILEVSLGEEHISRTDIEGVKSEVVQLQHAALVSWQLRSKRHQPSEDKTDSLSLQLHRPGEDTARYTVSIIDRPLSSKPTAYKFAAFVVPQGRETEYLFASAEGHRQLLATASAERLAIISLHRGHTYEGGLAAVKEELAPCIVQLAPPGLPPNTQIPFLSTGDDAGHREVIFQGHSDFSGDFVVEDVEVDGGESLRKLVFLGSRGVVQSEALLKSIGRRGKSNKGVKKATSGVDVSHLSCEHHRLMALSLALPENPQGLVIGLGGGGLCSFLHHCFPSCKVTAVEIDPAMVEVASQYFGLIQDERLVVSIGDGLKYLSELKLTGQQFDSILFDVDNKDMSLGMSCPPQVFVTDDILGDVKSALKANGLFVLNLVCRDPSLRKKTLLKLRQIFLSVLLVPLDGEVNEVVFCSTDRQEENMKTWLQQSAVKANLFVKKAKAKEELVNVTELLKNVNISPE